jgi:hypothetical protein
MSDLFLFYSPLCKPDYCAEFKDDNSQPLACQASMRGKANCGARRMAATAALLAEEVLRRAMRDHRNIIGRRQGVDFHRFTGPATPYRVHLVDVATVHIHHRFCSPARELMLATKWQTGTAVCFLPTLRCSRRLLRPAQHPFRLDFALVQVEPYTGNFRWREITVDRRQGMGEEVLRHLPERNQVLHHRRHHRVLSE